MSKRTAGVATLLVVCLTGSIRAQEITCEDIEFDERARASYPQIDDACLGVVENNGIHYARLHARIVRGGETSLVIMYEHRDRSYGPPTEVTPPPNFRVMVKGRPTLINDLRANDDVTVYVPEGRWAMAMADYEQPEIVEEYIVPVPHSEPVEPLAEPPAVEPEPQEQQPAAQEPTQEEEEPAEEEPLEESVEEEPVEEEPVEPPTEPEETPEGGSSLLWLVILGVIALLVIVLIARRRSDQQG